MRTWTCTRCGKTFTRTEKADAQAAFRDHALTEHPNAVVHTPHITRAALSTTPAGDTEAEMLLRAAVRHADLEQMDGPTTRHLLREALDAAFPDLASQPATPAPVDADEVERAARAWHEMAEEECGGYFMGGWDAIEGEQRDRARRFMAAALAAARAGGGGAALGRHVGFDPATGTVTDDLRFTVASELQRYRAARSATGDVNHPDDYLDEVMDRLKASFDRAPSAALAAAGAGGGGVTAEQVSGVREVVERHERAADAARMAGEVEYPVVIEAFARQVRTALGIEVQR